MGRVHSKATGLGPQYNDIRARLGWVQAHKMGIFYFIRTLNYVEFGLDLGLFKTQPAWLDKLHLKCLARDKREVEI